jgi:hypothetical protein
VSAGSRFLRKTSSMSAGPLRNGWQRIAALLRRTATAVEEIAEGEEPVATPPPGAASARFGDPSRETSTNARVEGAADEPWSGNR